MSVIIRLQNLPWSANALDIRNYFRGLSIPEGGVHIVGGELGDAFIAFSTDEDARQAMMLDGGKLKEIQVKLLLSSRSEMHKVIETARQTVPILSLAPPVAAPSPAPAPAPVSVAPPVLQPAPPSITPFSSVLASGGLPGFGIPGLGNPQEIPQPAVIEPPQPLLISPQSKTPDEEENDDKSETKRSKDRRRTRSRSRSRDRDRKDRKRDRRDRSRSRDRRRRDRSRSRDRRDRKRDRKDRSRSRERRSRDKRRSPQSSQERSTADKVNDGPPQTNMPGFPNAMNQMLNNGQPQMGLLNQPLLNGPGPVGQGRYADPALKEAFNKLQELGKKRNPNAFQGDQGNTGGRPGAGRGGNNNARGGGIARRDGRSSRFDDQPRDCCVAIRNAPNHTSYGDVRRFFPFMIDKHGIKMINDNMGRRTGSIFVRFCDPRSKQLALQKQPNELKGAMVTVESLEDELYDSAVDSYLPYRDDNDVQEQNSLVDQDNRRPAFTFSVLKLADLPHFVKEHDIVKAFSEFSLLSILLNDCRLTRTKIAFVQFVKPEDARKALERKESYLFGRRQPVITPVTDDEYENEKNTNEKLEIQNNRSMNHNEPAPEPVVPRDPRQRRQNDNGPGPNMQQQQPVLFAPNGPFQQNFNPGFANPQFAGYPGGNMDPRAAAANWASQNMAQQAHVPHQARVVPANNSQVINLDADDEPLDCVLMKGLPREATDRTILDFLSDTGAVPARIHLMLDPTGMPSGDCFCEFRSSQDARQAATKHGSNLDGNRITVDLVMRSVVEEALEGPKTDTKRDNMYGNGPPLLNNPPSGPMVPQMFEQPQNFSGRGGFRGRGFQRGGFDRGGYTRGGFDPSRGSFRGRGGWNERGRGFERGRGRGFARGRGGYGGGDYDNREPMRQEGEDSPPEDFGAPGCVVSMENVPFRATVDDILAFFSDFDLTQDDVIRRYNERGQPTGDARVAFPSPALAQRAVNSHNMNQIFERRVSLTLL